MTHDHADLNRRVLAIGARLRATSGEVSAAPLAGELDALREHLFMHFAREEEGLFPFVVRCVPELDAQVTAMEIAHDTICGGLARMCQLAAMAAPVARILLLFD